VHSVGVGVDFGSLGLRAAYATGSGPPVPLPRTAMERQSWILCEPSRRGPSPITFPSLKSKLGTHATVPVDSVVARLGELRREVEDRTSSTVARVVLSVPARYTSSQRRALHEVARQAGFQHIQLISDSIAAAIGYGETVKTGGTFVVYSMGYSGLELGLVRSAGGHYRVLGYEGLTEPGGLLLDRIVLNSWIAHQHRQLLSQAPHWDTATWLALRNSAQQVKEQLSTCDATFRAPIGGGVGTQPVEVPLAYADFEGVTASMFEASMLRLDALFEQTRTTMADVDTMLLVGGSTQIPSLQVALRARLDDSRISWAGDLARGAAVYASRLENAAASTWHADVMDTQPYGDHEPLEDIPAMLPSRQSPVVLEARQLLQPVDQLIDEGHDDQAAAFLRQLIVEAQHLLERASPAGDGHTHGHAGIAQHSLNRADRLLRSGRHEEAVRMSHLAWQYALEDPDVFERMIDLHCQAAMTEPAVDQYPDARRWLLCAHRHDQSNTRVRKLLAQRAFLHALDLRQLGRMAETVLAVNECLAWNPEHSDGNRLQQTLPRTDGRIR
jgi:hypothetical protein